MRLDVRLTLAYHHMLRQCIAGKHVTDEHTSQSDQPEVDPLTIGELITLQEAAEYAGLTYKTLLTYARKGRLHAKRMGWMWVTTHAAIDMYLQSRDLRSIPKKYRKGT
ncbi:MAG: helix-turn-helix domain-containing protein [Chloroflexales bacterium]|nr:helix-turn-helix domain-containing protein [Chloroflexales bacterium]